MSNIDMKINITNIEINKICQKMSNIHPENE